MKIILFVLITLWLYCVPSATAAQEASGTATKNRQIEDLKDRLATKVAELRQIQKRAVSGTVKSTSLTTLSVEAKTNEIKIELTDDIAVYQRLAGKRTKLTIDDVEKEDFVVVFGDYDTTLDLLKAKVIFIQAAPAERIHGVVTDIDRKNNTITIKTQEERNVIVDIERTTITNLWSKEDGTSRAGFSKIAVGDSIHVLGKPVPKKENRVSATRILDLGNLTGSPTEAPTPSPTPKLSPKPSPTPIKSGPTP